MLSVLLLLLLLFFECGYKGKEDLHLLFLKSKGLGKETGTGSHLWENKT